MLSRRDLLSSAAVAQSALQFRVLVPVQSKKRRALRILLKVYVKAAR